MYDDGIGNEFENAHQKGLRRGFDLGWSYKGRFDRQLIRDTIRELEEKYPKDAYAINVLKKMEKTLRDHPNNREGITLNSF
jgi:hypothetical protein